jgi:hypothetical protein
VNSLAEFVRTITLVSIVLFPLNLLATTITVVVTQKGIVIASDSGEETHTQDNRPFGTNSTRKIAIVRKMFAVASTGTADIQRPGGSTAYAFLEWINNIENKVPESASVDDLADIIEKESAITFKELGIDSMISSGVIKPAKPTLACEPFIQYIIVGYRGKFAKVYAVDFYIDWEKNKLIGPREVEIHPGQSIGTASIYNFGITEVLDDAFNVDSYAYKTISLRCPEFRTFKGGGDVALSDSAAIARSFVRLEEETNPTEVFGKIVGFVLPIGGSITSMDDEGRKILPKQTAAGKH